MSTGDGKDKGKQMLENAQKQNEEKVIQLESVSLEKKDQKEPDETDELLQLKSYDRNVDNVSKKHINILVKEAKKLLEGKSLSKGNAMLIAFSLMTVAKNFKKTGGAAKKHALMVALRMVVKHDKNMSDNTKGLLITFLDTVVSQAIENKYLADKLGDVTKKCWNRCC